MKALTLVGEGLLLLCGVRPDARGHERLHLGAGVADHLGAQAVETRPLAGDAPALQGALADGQEVGHVLGLEQGGHGARGGGGRVDGVRRGGGAAPLVSFAFRIARSNGDSGGRGARLDVAGAEETGDRCDPKRWLLVM